MAHWPRIPDLFTTANLASGVTSILLASHGQLTIACWLVFAGALFDVLDGLSARAFGGGSEFGKQLDSLADVITFGTAPAMLIWYTYIHHMDAHPPLALPVAIVSIPIASAWRLAKFNIDTRQTMGFLGLPTPSNGLFWTSLVLVYLGNAGGMLSSPALLDMLTMPLRQPMIALLLAIVLGGLMLSEVPLPGLKFNHFRWHGNEVIIVLAALGGALLLLFGIASIPMILVLYLLSPIWGGIFGR